MKLREGRLSHAPARRDERRSGRAGVLYCGGAGAGAGDVGSARVRRDCAAAGRGVAYAGGARGAPVSASSGLAPTTVRAGGGGSSALLVRCGDEALLETAWCCRLCSASSASALRARSTAVHRPSFSCVASCCATCAREEGGGCDFLKQKIFL